MGIRRSNTKNKKSDRPAAAADTQRKDVLRKATKPSRRTAK